MKDTIKPYNRGFQEFSAAYDAVSFTDIHKGAIPFLPATAGIVLDVGSGSGRDADWFASRGWDVIAAEPAAFMRQRAMEAHPSERIRWVDDRLPALPVIHRLGLAFDLIWLSGVWMHVEPEDRSRAMRKLATLLKPGGRMMLTLRHGPSEEDRPMWPVDVNEVERLGLDMGLALRVATDREDDLQGRKNVRWQTVVLDLPDDGVGALPLLRGVILRQEKSATYKLGLLRCIARIADASPSAAREGDDFVELPLGLIALYWLRMFKPLVEQGLPQLPGKGMGFVKEGFCALTPVGASDLRLGGVFAGAMGDALRYALSDAARLIADMPAKHLTFANDVAVFPTRYGRLPASSASVSIGLEYLWQFGTTRVPLTIWQALRRMAAWIEPMLIAEWVRLIQGYADRAGRSAGTDQIVSALRWIEPERDTRLVRDLAVERIISGKVVYCVWSGRKLSLSALDIDHCLPWSAWPCGDLWNLLPSSPAVNRHSKRELIISRATLSEAKQRILSWWEDAYLNGKPSMRVRFAEEARSTLPLVSEGDGSLEDLFQALDFRRLRLHQDTQVREWSGFTAA